MTVTITVFPFTLSYVPEISRSSASYNSTLYTLYCTHATQISRLIDSFLDCCVSLSRSLNNGKSNNYQKAPAKGLFANESIVGQKFNNDNDMTASPFFALNFIFLITEYYYY